MSFKAYIDNIVKQTKQTPEQIKQQGINKNILKVGITATEFCAWLANDYQLGRGHAMALWKYFIESKWITSTTSRITKK